MAKPHEPIADLPGWYEHPYMHESLCFWDGEEWTDQVAPKAQPFDFWRGVQVVALGSVVAVVLLRLLLGL